MSRTWRKGSTRAWRKLRLTILQRDGYRCRIQIPGKCVRTATHVHHTQGRQATGDDPRYLVAACKPCNLHLGNPNKQPDPPHKPITQW